MRVLVATDSIGSMSSAAAGGAIAGGWLRTAPDAQLAVVPMGEAGAGFAQAMADQWDVEVAVATGDGSEIATCVRGERDLLIGAEGPAQRHDPAAKGLNTTGSSAGFGEVVADQVRQRRPDRLLLDLAGLDTHDAGAGLLGALGATADVDLTAGVAGLADLTTLDLGPVRDLLVGVDLVAVVPTAELGQHLLGLRGITSLKGREADTDPAVMLAVDSSIERLAALAGPDAAGLPGAGACGGVAWAIAALGGRIVTAEQACAEQAGFDTTIEQADLVLTGSTVYDFASRGGGVMQYVAERAQQVMRPCIALAGEVVIGGREMRTMGIESAYPVHHTVGDVATGGDIGLDELAALAERVANSWLW